MKKLVLSAAATALLMSTALAQAPAPQSSTPPASTPPAASTDSATSSSGTTSSSASMNVVNSQSPDQFLASKFRGTDVVGTDNAKIGDVSDMLFDKSGKIEAFIVSVGGFLGVGSKDVAINPSAFEVVKGTNGEVDKLKLSATKDQLKQAQNFEPYNAPRPTATTGSGSAGGMRPATAPATSR